MKISKIIIGIILAAFVTGAAGFGRAQSLGDIARKLRAKQANQPKSTKVYTNDDIPPATVTGIPSAEGAPSETSAVSPATPETKKPEASSSEDKKMTKEYWQAEFRKARAEVESAQEESALADDELNLAQANQVREADPTKKEQFNQEIAAKQAATGTKHAALDKAKQALDDLTKRFNESGAPADWLPADDNKQ